MADSTDTNRQAFLRMTKLGDLEKLAEKIYRLAKQLHTAEQDRLNNCGNQEKVDE